MSELDRVKEQLVYLRFWLGIMVATEIALAGWLISTPVSANVTLWFMGVFGAGLLAVGMSMELLPGILLLAVVVLFVGIALDAAYRK
jgi:hypothetical protein